MRQLIEAATLGCLGFAAWAAILGDVGLVVIVGLGAAAFATLGAISRGTL